MTTHSILPPSSSERWLNCPPSATLEGEFPPTTSTAAEEGTAAHAFCEHKLKRALHKRSKRPVSEFDSDEMQECTDAYVEYVLEQLAICKQTCKDPVVLVEQKVDFSAYVENGFGTADCIIVAEDTMHIIDFKYGVGVYVEAVDNTQMLCYSVGALSAFDDLYDIKKITMHIFQPRRENVQSWSVFADEVRSWAELVLRPKALMALHGEGAYKAGRWCQFCRAAVKCRARAEEKLALAAKEFPKPPLLTDEEIEEVLAVIPDLTKWASDVQGYATDQAVEHGKTWEGFKLVEGRSNRKYGDEKEVASELEKNGYKDIYRKNLLTLTEMQKLLGKKEFEKILGKFIVKPKGKPTLVPESDKRPAIII